MLNVVQTVLISATAADGAGPKDGALASAVNLTSAFIAGVSISDERTGDERGGTIRIKDANTVELSWKGTLAGAEEIAARVYVVDLADLDDELKEAKFRLQRILGLLGENLVFDDPAGTNYNGAGVLVGQRMRIFNTKTNADAATPDLADGEDLETGELARYRMLQTVEIGTNKRSFAKWVLTDVAANPET